MRVSDGGTKPPRVRPVTSSPPPLLTPTGSAGTAVEEETGTGTVSGVADPWVTIVWNDPVHLMSYVTYVLESYFGYPRVTAERLITQVHENGRAVVSSGGRERMEADVQAMHGFGLWATLQESGARGAA